MRITGAEAILQCLIHEGVTILFGYPGGAIMPTYDALYYLQDKLRHILVRHEQGAIHAAEGYARITGKAGVCMATSGPGATNLITGIADAMLDSVPVVCITGQVFSALLGSDAFQEADIIGMTIPVTKWNYQITRSEEIPYMFAKGFYIANHGRPGPVLLDVTKDAQLGLLDFNYECYQPKKTLFSQASNYFPEKKIETKSETKTCLSNEETKPLDSQQEKIFAAAKLISEAHRPYLFVGHGVLIAKAEAELKQLVARANIPVASTLLGLSAFPTDHPLYAGMLGMHGNYSANLLTNHADVIIAVGMRFDDRVTGNLTTYAKQAKIIHIEIDPAEINKNVHVEIPLIGDAKIILQQLITALDGETIQHQTWIEEFKHYHTIEYEKIIKHEIHCAHGEIKMAEVIHQLAERAQGNAVIVSDVGQHQMVAARYSQFKHSNLHITSGGLGTMGFALPAAIGAKFANMSSQVIAIIGDGGFQMNIQELGVLAQENLPVKIIILNNSHLGMVRQWQELFFAERYSFVELKNPDFIKIAEGYGISGRKVENREQLPTALDELLNIDKPYLLEVIVENQENIFPMIPSGAGVGDIRLS